MRTEDDALGGIDRRAFVVGSGAGALSLAASRRLAVETDGERVARAARAVAARLSPDGDPVPLRLVHPEGCEANLAPVVARFRKEAGVPVELQPTALDDIGTYLLQASLADADTWDIGLPATFVLPDLVAADCLCDLTGFAEQHESELLRNGMLYAAGDWDRDRRFGYQTDGDAYLLFYHRGLLESAEASAAFERQTGRALAPAKSWRELDEMMGFFARAANGGRTSTLFRTLDYTVWEWIARFSAKGRWLLDAELEPVVDSAEGVAALEELIAASASQYPQATQNGLFDNWRAFKTGRHFCNLGWGGTQKALRAADSRMRDQVLVAPLPGADDPSGPASIGYFNWGWDYVVARRSPRAELAYLFCLFAVCPGPSVEGVRGDGFFDPFRTEHYDDPAIQATYGRQFLEVHRDSLRGAMPDLYLRSQSEYLNALRSGIGRAMAGEVTPKVAMGVVADSWRRIHERVGRDEQRSRWASVRTRFPQQLRAWLR